MSMNSIRRHCGYLLALAITVQAPGASAQGNNALGNAGNLIDIVGDWDQVNAGAGPNGGGGGYHEEPQNRGTGPDMGDYAGLPVNASVRYKAQAYSPDWLSVPERQCIPHPSTYRIRSPNGITLSKIYDPVTERLTAYQLAGNWGPKRTIWMDGRPHPGPNTLHTFNGFSTGRWVDDKLVIETTHIKAGWIRRNGVTHSDQVRMLEYIVRHDGYLTVITAVDDPLSYEEPFIVSTDFKVNVRQTTRMAEMGGVINGGPGATFYKCTPVDELDVEVGRVPHFIATQPHPELETWAKMYDIPVEAAFGGAETMYPEYRTKLRQMGGYQTGKATSMRTGPFRSTVVPKTAPVDSTVTSLHVSGQVWMISAGGQNVTVQIGDEGVLVVDPGRADLGAAVLAEIRKLAGDRPVREIIQSTSDISRIGATGVVGTPLVEGGQRPNVMGHEAIALRLSRAKASGDIVPNDTFFRGTRELNFNGEPIEIIHVPSARTDGDVIVFFRKSDVVSAGAVIQDLTYPDIETKDGGTIQGMVAGLNRILASTMAEARAEGGTLVIPAKGHIYDESDVAEYRDMVTIVRDRVQDAIARGLTLEQVKAEQLTRDYDGRYGAFSGEGSTARFLEAAYQTLKKDPS